MAKKIVKLSDQQVVDALNTRKDKDGKPLDAVKLENVWDECRAMEVGHRSCRCGNSGCGNS